jgi:hypothetical protein
MGNKILGDDIAGKIAREMGSLLLPGTLVRVTAGTRTPGNLTGGTNPTTVNKTFRGILSGIDSLRPGTAVAEAEGVILILGDTVQDLTIPEEKDRITFQGCDYEILKIGVDPDRAAYECQVKAT